MEQHLHIFGVPTSIANYNYASLGEKFIALVHPVLQCVIIQFFIHLVQIGSVSDLIIKFK